MPGMRAKLIVLIAMLAGCATGPNPKPNPCLGSYEDRKTMGCQCPGNLNPACAPFPSDAKRKKPAPPAPPATR
jgi:hypothetical protein